MSRLSWRCVIVWRSLAVGGSLGPPFVWVSYTSVVIAAVFLASARSALTFGYEATSFPGLSYCCAAVQSV